MVREGGDLAVQSQPCKTLGWGREERGDPETAGPGGWKNLKRNV